MGLVTFSPFPLPKTLYKPLSSSRKGVRILSVGIFGVEIIRVLSIGEILRVEKLRNRELKFFVFFSVCCCVNWKNLVGF